jgi:hypothetical protein
LSTMPAPAGVNVFAFHWPSDVLEFAARNQVADYLEPLREGLQQVFPTALTVDVTLSEDPGIPDEWYISLHVRVPNADIMDFVKAQHAWTEKKWQILPKSQAGFFHLSLTPVDQ